MVRAHQSTPPSPNSRCHTPGTFKARGECSGEAADRLRRQAPKPTISPRPRPLDRSRSGPRSEFSEIPPKFPPGPNPHRPFFHSANVNAGPCQDLSCDSQMVLLPRYPESL
jgi:hypothetical protein